MTLTDNDVAEFLASYPRMAIKPCVGSGTIFEGYFDFKAATNGHPEIADSYHLRISVAAGFPVTVPEITELDDRIPNDPDDHRYQSGELCLGSLLRLLLELKHEPTLCGFTRRCIVPFLYATSLKSMGHGYVFGELAHGRPGLLQDYKDLFDVAQDEAVFACFDLLGMKRRIANKRPCPCGCGRRLGKCPVHQRLNQFRSMAPRSRLAAYGRTLRNVSEKTQ